VCFVCYRKYVLFDMFLYNFKIKKIYYMALLLNFSIRDVYILHFVSVKCFT